MGIEDYATDGQNGRTDSLMFATVNPKTQKISLMSILVIVAFQLSERIKKTKLTRMLTAEKKWQSKLSKVF